MTMNLSCAEDISTFERVNNYFRDEDVVDGTEHVSLEFGYLITAAYFLVILFGAFGNFMTILLVAINPQMRTTRNYFILNLALSDFLVCTVTAPMTFYTVKYMFWPFGTLLCKFAGSLQGFNIFLSTFSITAIALDRYVLIIFPTKRERQRRLSIVFFLLIWLISLVLAIPLWIASDKKTIYNDTICGIEINVCHEQNEIWDAMIISKHTYTIGLLVTQYALPLCSIVFAYTKIVKRMKLRFANRNFACSPAVVQDERRKSVVDRTWRTHMLLVFVVILFALAWLPLNVFHVINTFQYVAAFSVKAFAICHVTAMCSACLNPLIYAFFNQNFRIEFVRLFERIGFRSFRKIFGDSGAQRSTVYSHCVQARSTRQSVLVIKKERIFEENLTLPLDTDEQL